MTTAPDLLPVLIEVEEKFAEYRATHPDAPAEPRPICTLPDWVWQRYSNAEIQAAAEKVTPHPIRFRHFGFGPGSLTPRLVEVN